MNSPESRQTGYVKFEGDGSNLSWKLPAGRIGDKAFSKKHNNRNKYLKFMEIKIMKEMRESPEKAWKTFERFSRRSRVWAIYIAHDSIDNLYLDYSKEEAVAECKKFVRMMRLKHYKMDVERIYIEKKDGSLRPVGSPRAASRMVYACYTKFLEKWMLPQIGEYQHGFRKGKGSFTAGLEVVKAIKAKKSIYEFDLKSFFNKVNAELTGRQIRKELKDLGNIVRYTNRHTEPRVKELHESDKEISVGNSINGKTVWLKSGFTQGANWSPLICIWVLELSGMSKIDGLIMYADDGLVVRDNENDTPTIANRKWGIEIAENKQNGWVKDTFEYLGIKYSREQQTMEFNDEILHIPTASEEEITRMLKYSKYQGNKSEEKRHTKLLKNAKKGSNWVWVGKDKSMMVKYGIEGNKYLVGQTGVTQVNPQQSSTKMVDILLEEINGLSEWTKAQRVKVKVKAIVRRESEKLFNIHTPGRDGKLLQAKLT